MVDEEYERWLDNFKFERAVENLKKHIKREKEEFVDWMSKALNGDNCRAWVKPKKMARHVRRNHDSKRKGQVFRKNRRYSWSIITSFYYSNVFYPKAFFESVGLMMKLILNDEDLNEAVKDLIKKKLGLPHEAVKKVEFISHNGFFKEEVHVVVESLGAT